MESKVNLFASRNDLAASSNNLFSSQTNLQLKNDLAKIMEERLDEEEKEPLVEAPTGGI